MITLGLCTEHDSEYPEVCAFAQEVYQRRHRVELDTFPKVFSTARFQESLVGCLGLSTGIDHDPLLFETHVPFNVLERLSGGRVRDRAVLGELGTRCVETGPMGDEVNGKNWGLLISVGLSGTLILEAKRRGCLFLTFTTHRSVLAVTESLGFTPIEYGRADISTRSPEFQEKWRRFFRIPQMLFSFEVIPAVSGCRAGLSQLEEEHGFRSVTELMLV